MKIIKRDGREVNFNKQKIVDAVLKAFEEVDGEITEEAQKISELIALSIERICLEEKKSKVEVEEIQDKVEQYLMTTSRPDVGKEYVRFRYKRELARVTSLDKTVLEIVKSKNEYWNSENSNKNPRLNTTIRDYIAGAVSSNLSRKMLLPHDVIDAHDKGIIHFHDIDYAIQRMHNCDLVNIEDMLQNGTVISEVGIDTPHSFSTACTITTQIIAQVASAQYGGQSISLAHLAPFVDVSRQKFIKEVAVELYDYGFIKEYNENLLEVKWIAEDRLKKEISKGIQTIQYQITTLMTTNG